MFLVATVIVLTRSLVRLIVIFQTMEAVQVGATVEATSLLLAVLEFYRKLKGGYFPALGAFGPKSGS